MKFFAVLILIVCGFQYTSYAQLPNQGCNNGQRIYTQYLGPATFFGQTYDVYSINGSSLRIYNNEDGKNTPKCNEVNANPKGWTDAGGNQCWIADRVPPNNNQQNSDGSYVSWQTKVNVKPYTKCNAPLDSHVIYMLSAFGILGFYFLRKRLNIIAEVSLS